MTSMLRALVLLTIAAGSGGAGWQADAPPPVEFVYARALVGTHTIRASFAVRSEPYRGGTRGAIELPVPEDRRARAKDGLIISAFGFYAWKSAGVTQLRVLEMVPGPGAPNEFLWKPGVSRDLLRPRPFASYTLKLGETRTVDAMKPLGLDPMVVTLDTKESGG